MRIISISSFCLAAPITRITCTYCSGENKNTRNYARRDISQSDSVGTLSHTLPPSHPPPEYPQRRARMKRLWNMHEPVELYGKFSTRYRHFDLFLKYMYLRKQKNIIFRVIHFADSIMDQKWLLLSLALRKCGCTIRVFNCLNEVCLSALAPTPSHPIPSRLIPH